MFLAIPGVPCIREQDFHLLPELAAVAEAHLAAAVHELKRFSLTA